MARAYCKRVGCGSWFNAGATTNEAQKHGYCSWSCFEADNPELAKQARKQRNAAEMAGWAAIIAVLTAIFFGVRWLLRKRKEDPPLFKKIMMWGGCTCAALLVLAPFAGFSQLREEGAKVSRTECKVFWDNAYYLQNAGSTDEEKRAFLEKAKLRCPAGGIYHLDKQGHVVCSKDGDITDW
jgi:hypothetical protein